MAVMSQQKRPRRSFPDAYKAAAVGLWRTGGKSVGAVAHDLGLSETAVCRWIARTSLIASGRCWL
jgi:transposase-like protein